MGGGTESTVKSIILRSHFEESLMLFRSRRRHRRPALASAAPRLGMTCTTVSDWSKAAEVAPFGRTFEVFLNKSIQSRFWQTVYSCILFHFSFFLICNRHIFFLCAKSCHVAGAVVLLRAIDSSF